MTGDGELPPLLWCADFGSTFTKVALVDTTAGELAGIAQHPTTIDTDLFDGFEAARAEILAVRPDAAGAPVAACSSAGGGLRIAVVGNEELVTAEAGRRVALSSGGRIAAVIAGGLDDARYRQLLDAEPDVILLVGGTDGGNAEQFVADARFLAAVRWSGPVVVAGDVASRDEVVAVLDSARTPCLPADNVVPRIGVLEPTSARAAIREVFLAHVIGGKHLSARREFVEHLLGPTPDVVLVGAEVLAAAHGSQTPGTGVVVVDVGGATTDVYSVLVPDPEERDLARDVVAVFPVTRTVEGDLGVNASAETTRESARLAGLPARTDLDLAAAAILLAVRRHAGRARVVLSPEGGMVERSGADLRDADLLVGSGGTLRAADPAAAAALLLGATGEHPDGWQLPRRPQVVVDADYVLAPAGLIVLYGERVGATQQAMQVARSLVSTRLLTTGNGRSSA